MLFSDSHFKKTILIPISMYHLWDSLAVQEFARVYSIKFHVSLICEHIKYLSRQYQNIN
jgi:hypothetical protein